MDLHRFHAHPDPDPLRLSILMPIRILSQVLHMLEYQKLFFDIIHSSLIFHCLIFLFSVIEVSYFSIFWTVMEISWKKCSLALHLVEMDPDPPKLCRSDRIQIHNTFFPPSYRSSPEEMAIVFPLSTDITGT